jgi:signal transduction histidine kinase
LGAFHQASPLCHHSRYRFVSICDLFLAIVSPADPVLSKGIGIPSEIRVRLFQPFFTTKPPGEVTGLRLSMSYDIITQQHGGTISVDSRVGEYSEFTVRLPHRS